MKATFDGRVFVPEQPVQLVPGTVVHVAVPTRPASAARAPLRELVQLLKQFPSDPNWPADAAARHDHYLYGTPKQP